MEIDRFEMLRVDRSRAIGFTVLPASGGEHRFVVSVDDEHPRLKEIVDQLEAELIAEMKRTTAGWLNED